MSRGTIPPESTSPGVDSTQMALDRTWLAHERTLMAWVRTATSMISFGFTIYKFFEFDKGVKAGEHGLLTPRDFAMAMVSIGLVALLLATFAHRRGTRELSELLGSRRRSLAQVVSALVSVFGIFVLLSALFRG
jgi:putative membrane protein